MNMPEARLIAHKESLETLVDLGSVCLSNRRMHAAGGSNSILLALLLLLLEAAATAGGAVLAEVALVLLSSFDGIVVVLETAASIGPDGADAASLTMTLSKVGDDLFMVPISKIESLDFCAISESESNVVPFKFVCEHNI
jgi:hypothetical protein